MAISTLRFLGSILLLGATMGVVACGSTVTGGEADGDDGASDDGVSDDGSDDGPPPVCGDVPPDCSSPVCTDVGWDCGPAPTCPAAEPTPGAACTGDLSCSFGGDMGDCSSGRTYDCVDGAWSQPRYDRCSPPLECPAIEPAPHTPCDVWGMTCEYDTGVDCGPGSVAYTCEDGVWSDPMVPRCALPPCRDVADQATCEDFGCRWLEPGCGGTESVPSLPAAGCFDAAPCGEDSCLFADETCTEVMVMPDCENCDACGIGDFVCLPPQDGG